MEKKICLSIEQMQKLKELGYKECIGEEGPFLFTSYNIFDCMHSQTGLKNLARNGLIDCGCNEKLFLALAALRDDSDIHQQFIYDNSFGTPEYKKCLEDIGNLEYKDSFGKGRSGMKTDLRDKPLKFLKGTY